MKIDVLYFEGCPNHRPAVALAESVATELGVEAQVREVPVNDADDAHRLGFFGSPSIQVDGVDIDPATQGRTDFAFSCRMYGSSGVPPKQMLVDAIRSHTAAGTPGR